MQRKSQTHTLEDSIPRTGTDPTRLARHLLQLSKLKLMSCPHPQGRYSRSTTTPCRHQRNPRHRRTSQKLVTAAVFTAHTRFRRDVSRLPPSQRRRRAEGVRRRGRTQLPLDCRRRVSWDCMEGLRILMRWRFLCRRRGLSMRGPREQAIACLLTCNWLREGVTVMSCSWEILAAEFWRP